MTTRAKTTTSVDTTSVDTESTGWTNIDTKLEGDTFIIMIDLSKEGGYITGSGKSKGVATTHGNVVVPGRPDVRFAVNCYKPLTRDNWQAKNTSM